jgi:acetyl-CoA carboxylase biotin carboxyl carrier protein
MDREARWLDTLHTLFANLAESDVVELRYQGPGLRVRLRRRASPRTAATQAFVDGRGDRLHALRAPLTGVFYAAPSPQAEPYVQEGDWVEPGRVMALIETMKVFNEVLADERGRVQRIHVISGQLVHQGDPLFSIDPQGSPPLDGVP